MSTLYELVGERLVLQSRLEDMDFDTETIQDTLEANSTELEAKVTNYGYVIKNMASFRGELQRDIDRQQLRLDRYMKREDVIKEWLLSNMQRCNINKIECPSFTLRVQLNPAIVVVAEGYILPDEFTKTSEPKPPVVSPDKVKIAAALKSGRVVDGCRLEQTPRLVIS